MPSSEQAADDIFLSPRVIDTSALDELEGRLRRVIDHALETGQALVSLDEESKASIRALDRAGPAIDTRARAAAKLLQSLDQRVSEAEALLGRAIERAERAENFEGDVDEIVARAEQKLQLRVDAMVADGESRLKQAEAAMHRRIDEAAERAEQRLTDRASEAGRTVEATLVSLSESTRDARASATDLEQRLTVLRAGVDDTSRPLADLCERAERLLDDDGMTTLVDRAERSNRQMTESIARLEQAHAQTEQARHLLLRALRESGTKLDDLGDRHRGLRRDITESAALCDAAAEATISSAEELRAALREPLGQADAQAARLSDLIARAETAANAAADASAAHNETMARVDEALGKLAPWRATLLEGSADLPAPLRSVVDEFRVEIGRRVGRIGDELKSIADR